MDYKLKVPIRKKSRWTLGFLDENLNNDYYTQMYHGVFEAARKLQVDVIRFAYYPNDLIYDNDRQVQMILDLIQQFQLDGLLFLGWSWAGPLHNQEFSTRTHGIPLLSIGTIYEDIPYVNFPGDRYIRELCFHLIEVHHYRRIAYIAPLSPDDRNRAYLDLMQEYDIYDPELYVSEQDLANTPFTERGSRALAILLDERRAPFDAIMTTCSEETGSLLTELNRRGLRVPADIAVTTYEDQNTAKYSTPGLTTVYFPAVEMGYSGCMKLVELLNQGHIPLGTETPGKVVYRASCGCMSSSIKAAASVFTDDAIIVAGAAETADSLLNTGPAIMAGDVRAQIAITESDTQKIVSGLKEAFPYTDFDFERLLAAFVNDLKTKSTTAFISELTVQLSKVTDNYIQSNIRDLISVFRRWLLPYFLHDQEALLWAGNLLQQGQVLAWEKTTNVFNSAKVDAKIRNQVLQEFGQSLITSFKTEDLLNCLAKNLPKLQIPGCYIFLFQTDGEPELSRTEIFDRCELVFAYSSYQRHMTGGIPAPLPQTLAEIISGQNSSATVLAHLLHVSDEFMGFILFEPGPMDQMMYQTLANQISIAIRGAWLLEKLDISYLKLAEQAYREGMAEISTQILHNIGNILNSINIAVSLMKSGTDSMLIPYLMEANQMLTANLADLENFIATNPKGKKLLQFYLKLGSSFKEVKSQIIYNVNRLDDKVQSIVNLISAQQAYAGVKEVIEKVDVANVIDDALKLMADSFVKYQIKVIKNYQTRVLILAPRLKLFQVLFHLINYAREAMVEIPVEERMLLFNIDEDDEGYYICIRDNGRGIPENLLEKIFEFGFPDPHGHEPGLYNCKKYMMEMGGDIRATGNGSDRGMTFVLRFRREA